MVPDRTGKGAEMLRVGVSKGWGYMTATFTRPSFTQPTFTRGRVNTPTFTQRQVKVGTWTLIVSITNRWTHIQEPTTTATTQPGSSGESQYTP